MNTKWLTFVIDEEEEFAFVIDNEEPELAFVVEGSQILPDKYSGPYIVEPKWEDQVLSTKNKLMGDDVTVLEIKAEKVTNPSGGYTVTIGG